MPCSSDVILSPFSPVFLQVYVLCHGLRSEGVAIAVQTLVETGACNGSIFMAPNVHPRPLFTHCTNLAKYPALCIGT